MPLSAWPFTSEGRDIMLDPGCHGLWLPPEMGLYWIPSPRETDPTHLRNRAPDLQSGPWDPHCIGVDWPEKRRTKVYSQGCLTPGPAPCTTNPSIESRAWIVRPPYIWTTAVQAKVIRGPAREPRRATGVPPRTRKVNGVDKGKSVSSIWGHQPPNSPPTSLRAQKSIPWGVLGFCPAPLFEPDLQTPLFRWVSLPSVCHHMGHLN